jgi:hypothetical protein
LSAFAARKALAGIPSTASKGQNGGPLLEAVQTESKSMSSKLTDPVSETGNGMSALTNMKESAKNETLLDLDENTDLSSYAQSEPHET